MTRGVVAAAHPASAEAGASVLRDGGTAIDAAIATALAACVAEQPIMGLAGGGFMLVHDAVTRSQTLLDFFVTMPGTERPERERPVAEFVPVPVNFGGTVQMFNAGTSAVGVPGVLAGLCAAHEHWGTRPLSELIQPARELALRGFTVTKQQEYLFEILEQILLHSTASRALFTRDKGPCAEGDVLANPQIADVLTVLAEQGCHDFYRGDRAAQLVAEMQESGGRITANDLATYAVVARDAARISYRGAGLATNPPPSSGGPLMAYTFGLLSHFDLPSLKHGSYDHLRILTEAMRHTLAARKARFDKHVHAEDVMERLLAEERIEADRRGIAQRLGNTSHISTIDEHGNAVSLTCSNGEGAGVMWSDTGIALNNVLGEEDLSPRGVHAHAPGARLSSMMAPTIVLHNGSPQIAVGSAGSNRIRSAVLQTISNALDFGMAMQEAVNAPRVHVEAERVELEIGVGEAVAEALGRDGHSVHLWGDRNLFFGGVQAVMKTEDGSMTGAGDPRRGGVAIAVDRA